jgi:nucleoside-diphosphate-sugar epimerase
MDADGRSKVLAEQAAWDLVESEGRRSGLTTILPVAVMGPVTGKDISGSNQLIQRMLAGQLPGFPNLWIPIVDVRDVARAHVLASGIPDFVVRLAARFNAEFGPMAPDLGYAKKVSGDKARTLLGLAPRDPEEAIVAAAESMVRKSLVTS